MSTVVNASLRTPTRRQTIAWFAAAAASPMALAGAPARAAGTGWPVLALPRIAAPGYGADPDIAAKKVTWPLSLDPAQRALVRVCADLILPPLPGQKPPSTLALDAFVDEWVSAPYELQAKDRILILTGLHWLDAEAQATSGQPFAHASEEHQRAILDTIAWRERITPDREQAAAFFARLRAVIVLGYYTLPEGEEDLGFIGNTPIAGVYPGPGAEPLKHLERQLARLGLSMPIF